MQFRIVQEYTGDRIEMTADDGVVWSVPANPANSDYLRYQEWLAEGNEPEIVTP